MICLNHKMLLSPSKNGSLASLNTWRMIYISQEKATEESMFPIFHGEFINGIWELRCIQHSKLITWKDISLEMELLIGISISLQLSQRLSTISTLFPKPCSRSLKMEIATITSMMWKHSITQKSAMIHGIKLIHLLQD